MSDVTNDGSLRQGEAANQEHFVQAPAITQPKGGGAIRGIGEKFAANPVTGTASMTVPVAASPGRSGFGPQLSLSYDSGAGNGPFGLGWNLPLPAITRKTDKGLPRYNDPRESDVFILSGAEDLVPAKTLDRRTVDGKNYSIRRYRPRIEGLFARIECWTDEADAKESFWRSISRDNITTWYGRDDNSRIFDPADPTRIFSWLICESHDDKGNVMVYRYKEEDSTNVVLAQAHERNRSDDNRSANRYLKWIRYGNHAPYYPRLLATEPWPSPPDTRELDGSVNWYFEVVFDYGEHHPDVPNPGDAGQWDCRADPFSSYRAGFEVRTYRLCQRVLMFHHFPGEQGVGANCLVRSTDFTYRYEQVSHDPRNPIHSVLTSVTQSGYKRREEGSYLKKSLPPLEFEYSEAIVSEKIEEVDAESLENLPYGADGGVYQWVDLDGEGLSGVLTEQATGWFYKRNESPITRTVENGIEHYSPRFAPVEQVASIPASRALSTGQMQFLDLAGDGQVDLVELDRPVPGFYERTEDQGWETFRPFQHNPSLFWQDPNLRFVDLTGDGHADLLITEDEIVTWYPSLAEAGFGPAETVPIPTDEERGPRVIFADGVQTMFLADLSGDGLSDIVRIRNGEVCYWPNLGYGRFGPKVTMDGAPRFDAPDQFDPKRIRLADIDGSGVTDILYLGRDGVWLYFNQSGNSWSEARHLSDFPAIDDFASVQALDLLGIGTACLVWSTPLPGMSRSPMRYLNLMAQGKPHLLVTSRNNFGAETRIRYVSSTYFYLNDNQEGRPWVTRLPFPVHVVERVETYDRISRNRFVSRYAYHHGYFDGVEREFRGFGMVEQWDTEEIGTVPAEDISSEDVTNWDTTSFVPSAYTKTWFHTGVYIGRGRISNFFAGLLDAEDTGEYYRAPGWDDPEARQWLLDDTILPDGLTPEEEREACRALKGSILRQEVYARDGTPKADHPYSVSERNYTIRRLQPRGDHPHAVFFIHPRETLNYHYERNPEDPRVQHELVLEVDRFGNVLKSVAIGYGRRISDLDGAEDREKQTRPLITYTQSSVTNPIDEDDAYRTPLPCEAQTYQLTDYTPAETAARFQISDFVTPDPDDPEDERQIQIFENEINYEDESTNSRQRRLIEHIRTLYRPDDLGLAQNDPMALLPLHVLQSLALAGESYKLAFTPGLLAEVFRRDQENLLPDPASILGSTRNDGGGYVDLDRDGHWWIPSGRIFHSPDSNAAPGQELDEARGHFFLPRRYEDPFGHNSVVDYDGPEDPNLGRYDLLVSRTLDPLGNEVHAASDYRVLQPALVIDPNGNRTGVAFDVLGLVVGTAVMGKEHEPDGSPKGDRLDSFMPDLALEEDIRPFVADPSGRAPGLLGDATTRIVYDIGRYQRCGQPPFAAVMARETHVSDLPSHGHSRIQVSFVYSDGFGREIQTKIQAEPGDAPQREENLVLDTQDIQPGALRRQDDGELFRTDTNPRWVGTGRTVYNNKGKPVKKYEPFFGSTHLYEPEPDMTETGVTPVLFYDPVGRLVATLHPNDTYEKVVFDPWQQTTYDVNDACAPRNQQTGDPRTDPDIQGYVAEYFKTQPDDWHTWHDRRTDGQQVTEEQDAAAKAARHADTPAVAFFDTLGRSFLTVAHNRLPLPPGEGGGEGEEQFYATRIELDIEGNQRAVIDARGLTVMRYDYDLLGNRIHQASMDAGERWMLSNVAGKPIRAWDSRDHTFRTTYDVLHRPTGLFGRRGNGVEVLVERTVYGESHPDAFALNLRGRVYQHYDQAGLITNMGHNPDTNRDEAYDFKGNPLHSRRQLAVDYKNTLDWWVGAALEEQVFAGSTTYDALNRPVTLATPDGSVIRPVFNEANLLDAVRANLRGAEAETEFVRNIDYDAKGQRERIRYGNGVTTTYEYDEQTFRLIHLQTLRGETALQDLRHTYDPAGNITHIQDNADIQNTIYFRNQRVEPSNDYTYDALYRLIEASGREHLGQSGSGALLPPVQPGSTDAPRAGLLHPGDGNAMGNYTERYDYDEVGNILRMIHTAGSGGWTRRYAYAADSNRLLATSLPGDDPLGPYSGGYGYDAHGNVIRMPHLSMMEWDYRDQLHATARQVVSNGGTPEITYYVYDAAGQRVRKVTERQAAASEAPTRMKERIYLGSFEIYREYNGVGETVTLERETLHIMDDKQRIALVETRTQGDDGSPAQVIRYQFGNHLGSASLELDDEAQIISYEEYFPYGSTSYQAVRNGLEVSQKRYRYTGMERDEENGLNYHGARYYAAWLGRWTACDPVGLRGGINQYKYSSNNPILFSDTDGLQSLGELAASTASNTPRQRQRRHAEQVRRVQEQRELQENLESLGTEPPSSEQWRNDLASVNQPAAIDIEGAPIEDVVYIREIPRELELMQGSAFTPGMLAGAINVTNRDEYERLLANAERVQAFEAALHAVGPLAAEHIRTARLRTVQPRRAPLAERRRLSPHDGVNNDVREGGERSMYNPEATASAAPAQASTSPVILNRRWRVGDPHNALTRAGREPSWATVRMRYWKNLAATAPPGEFSPENLARMRKGRAPRDPVTGQSMELEHLTPQRTGDPNRHRDLLPVWPWEHAFFDRYRQGVTDASGQQVHWNTALYDNR